MMLLALIFDVYSLVVLAAVVLSWIGLGPDHPLVRSTGALTEPLLQPIRRVLPAVGGFDLSPVVLLVALRLLRSILLT
jgi:YggT family protein